MRQVFTILILIVLSSAAIQGQKKSDLAGNIIKPEFETTTESPLTINSFSYSGASDNGIINLPRTKPGIAFLSSAIIPGTGQAANGKWGRAATYIAVEAFSIFYHFNRLNKAREQEELYNSYADRQWSVVAYAQWLVNYYDANGLSHNGLETLRTSVQGETPNFGNTQSDWAKVDIQLLQEIEQSTPLVCGTCGNRDFSHVLPAYGSQQYYELISKYYQFEGGWSDFYSENVAVSNPAYNYQYDNDGSFASEMFFLGAERAGRFNDNYRRAGNIISVLVVNHVFSAFDALFTVKLKNSRIQAQANLQREDSFSLTFHF